MDENESTEYSMPNAASDKGFVFIYPAKFRKVLSGLGKEQYRFAMHLLRIRNRNNIVKGTVDGFASQIDIHKNTASSALKILMENDFIRRAGIRSFMINPAIVFSTHLIAHSQQMAQYLGLESVPEKKNLFSELLYEDRTLFMKVWIGKLADTTSDFGQKQIQFLLYLLSKMNYDGCLSGTREQLAKRAKVSRETARDTIKLMKERDLIVRVGNGLLMFNPYIVSRDTSERRRDRIKVYQSYKRPTKQKICDK